MTEYNASKRKKLFRARVTRGLEVTELNKPTRGSIWAYDTPTGVKHLWLHFDRNYNWWKVCSRPQSDERFRNPVLHGFLGPKEHEWHIVSHEKIIHEFNLIHSDDQIQVKRQHQMDLFDEYRDINVISTYQK